MRSVHRVLNVEVVKDSLMSRHARLTMRTSLKRLALHAIGEQPIAGHQM